jgi:hypothetical protein
MPSKPRKVKRKKPRNYLAVLAFTRSGGGVHVNKKDKRKQQKLKKEMEEDDGHG